MSISATLQSRALIPQLMNQSKVGTRTRSQLGTVLLGVGLLSLLAQVTIRLPFTPVPITGQTFGVFLVTLLLGRRMATATVISYLGVGAIGLPVFAMGQAGLAIGPTMGYLLGMLVSSFVVGTLADCGYAKTFLSCLGLGVVSSVCVFGFGLAGLSFFIPSEMLFSAGFIPFIPGDLIKTVTASLIVTGASKQLNS
ncbi:MAG: biotin transporter BioY [Bdellovibrionales bacterium]